MVNQETKFVLREERKADADHEDLYVYGLALPRDDYRVTKISDEKAAIKQLRGFEGRPVKMEHGQEVLGSVHTVEFKREGMFVGLKLFPPASVEDHNVHLARKVRGLILQRRLKELSIGFYTTDTGISPIEISLTSEGALKVGLYNFVSFSSKSNFLRDFIFVFILFWTNKGLTSSSGPQTLSFLNS